MRALLGDLVRFARCHFALSISLALITVVGVLLLVGVDSSSWLLAFIGLGVVYLGFAVIDLRDEFRKRPE